MIRRIIQIDEEKCNGCGICEAACHEGAIAVIDGKARLTRDDYCDGFGDCLPGCPTGAITFVEKDTLAYDEEAVMENKKRKEEAKAARETEESKEAIGTRETEETQEAIGTRETEGTKEAMETKEIKGTKEEAVSPATRTQTGAAPGGQPAHPGCPGSRMASFDRRGEEAGGGEPYAAPVPRSQLGQWPCQIKLVPVGASFFNGAKLLVAADCTAYAYANVHQEYMRGRVTLIGCPKLDSVDYSEKLTAILQKNDIREVTVLRMQVPCCGGLEAAVVKALKASGRFIPWQVVTFAIDGRKLD